MLTKNTSGKKTGQGGGNIILITFIVFGVGVLCSLGTWQVYRLNWKLNLIEKTEGNIKKSPVDVLSVEGVNDQNEYSPVTTKGTFQHQNEKHLLGTHKSQSGFFVFTPLKLSDGNGVVFVNRGFVTPEYKQTNTRINPQGEVTVTGLLRSAPKTKPNRFVPDNDIDNNVYYWKSLSDMTKQNNGNGNVMPFFVDADNTPNPQGRPKGGVTIVRFNNPHLGYAVTWFGLAITLIIVGTTFVRSRRKQK